MAAGRSHDGPTIVRALRAGDEDALSELYARWSPLVYSLALRSLGQVGAAEDVTKRVFTEVWATRDELDPARSSFSSRLIDLACALIADAETAPGRPSRPAGAPSGADAEEQSGGSESGSGSLAERLVLADGLSHLDPVPQRVLRMVLDDLSPAEVAERTGLSVEDVKTQIASSLIQLRHRWEVPTRAH